MKYEAPRIKTTGITDLLTQLGPARALMYVPGDGNPGGTGGGSISGGSSSSS